MQIRKVFCLFEQSGTFKNEFKKLGIHAEDYDILNDFGETDHQADLFAEIEKAYAGEPSLFDEVESGDLVLAFFPCTRFECQAQMLMSGDHYALRNFTDVQKLEYAMKTHEELHKLYMLLCKLFVISNLGGVENDCRKPMYSAALPDRVFSD